MWSELFRKWFGLEPSACPVCEVLREQLANSERERRELLQRALAPSTPEIPQVKEEEFKPIQSQFVPWRVRQQMLEAEDRKRAELMREKEREISQMRVSELEKELEIDHAS